MNNIQMSTEPIMATYIPKIIIISGPSGVGKTSICEEILMRMKGMLYRSVSATTRAKRLGETEGLHYHFLTSSDFEEKIKENEFIEYAKVHNNYYGTLKKNVYQAFEKKLHCLVEIDVQGAKQIQQNKEFETVSIFIGLSDLEDIKKRFIDRGSESTESIETRTRNMLLELKEKNYYDFYVENICLQKSIETIEKIILTGKSS